MVRVEPERLLQAVEAFGTELFRNASHPFLQLRLDRGRQQLELTVTSADADQADSLPIDPAGPEDQAHHDTPDLLLNPEHLKDAARAFIGAGPLVLRVWTPSKPVVFSAVQAEEGHVCAVMPFHHIR